MNEYEILKSISNNLTSRKNSAALSNFEVLCNNITYLNNCFKYTVYAQNNIRDKIVEYLTEDYLLNNEFKKNGNLHPFTSIIPAVITNGMSIAEKFSLYTEPVDRGNITVENVGLLHKGFIDYNHLVTASRQYIDSLISDAYQLHLLDAKSLNYHVLVSLNSFNKFATDSLKQTLLNAEVSQALTEFSALNYRDWKSSSITQCNHLTFGNKVDFLFTELGISTEIDFSEKVKNLFKFSSEFTHIGYVSTFFTSSEGAEIIFGDTDGPYLPSTENFNELKFEILETACKSLVKIYLPCLANALKKVIVSNKVNELTDLIKELGEETLHRINTRNSQYYFFIKNGIIGSQRNAELKCMCGQIRNWEPPHDKSLLYCSSCGSTFNLMEVEGNGGYIIKSNGPVKIIGSDEPDFDELPMEKQMDLLRKVDEIKKEKAGL